MHDKKTTPVTNQTQNNASETRGTVPPSAEVEGVDEARLIDSDYELARNTEETRGMAQTCAEDASVNEGRVIDGRYELGEKLGAGGMGMVYRACQRSLNREVAIKMMRPSDTALGAKRFLREIELASFLHHPNIVVVHDCGQTHDGWLYLVMESVQGRTLEQLLDDDGPLSPERLRSFTIQICTALAFAHEHDIVHRDLKPSNIMVDERTGIETIKILDFGLAKSTSDKAHALTAKDAHPLGTPIYMSPEVIRGGDATAASDMYSLGCTLFTLATGEPPFRAATIHSLFDLHTDARPPLIARRDLQELPTIVHTLLAKDPTQRIASAQALRDRLETTTQPLQRRSFSTLAVALIAVVVVVVVAAAAWQLGKREGSVVAAAPVSNPAAAIEPKSATDRQPVQQPLTKTSATSTSERNAQSIEPLDAAPSRRGNIRARPRETRLPPAPVKPPLPTITADADGDGVPNTDDSCPKFWGRTRGCPGAGARVGLPLEFAANTATLRTTTRLTQLANTLKNNPGITRLQVRGHAAAAEGAQRTALSWQRANAIKHRLVQLGVATHRLGVHGYGRSLYAYAQVDVVVAGALPQRLSSKQISAGLAEIESLALRCLPRSMRPRSTADPRAAAAKFYITPTGRAKAAVTIIGYTAAAATCLQATIRAFRFPRARTRSDKVTLQLRSRR